MGPDPVTPPPARPEATREIRANAARNALGVGWGHVSARWSCIFCHLAYTACALRTSQLILQSCSVMVV